MFLDKQNNRKQLQIAYRKELKDELDHKKSRIITNSSKQDYRPENGAFSLITNIQRQQNQRKKKNQDYYNQLRMQIDQEKRMKDQKEAEQKRKEQYEEDKLKQEQQRLKQRYQNELKRQNKGRKSLPTDIIEQPQQDTKKRKDHSLQMQLQQKHLNYKTNLQPIRQKTYSQQSPQRKTNYQFNIQPPINLYPNKIENETFNYVPRKSFKDNYYKQLLGQRRKLDEETNQISQLNRMFNVERFRKKQQSKGLQELKFLQRMLQQKNTNYLQVTGKEENRNYSQSGNLKSISKASRTHNIPIRLKDQWRKLD